ncbi:MAG: hypothetical protein Kow00108_12170 [Calditrichia bacterium]
MKTEGGGEHATYSREKDYDFTSCATCHGADLKGGKTEVSCYTCHTTFPHETDWVSGDTGGLHASLIRSDSLSTDDCTSCHGTDLKGGTSQVSCYTCHTTYPHSNDWVQEGGGAHAAFLIESEFDLTSCQSCHGSDYTGGSSKVSCYTCHNSYPHDKNWVSEESDNHGEFLEENDFNLSLCSSCHGSDFTGDDTGVSCYTCHEQYPHSNDIAQPGAERFHSYLIKAENWDLSECQDCHKSDFSGPTTSTNCLRCHNQPDGPFDCATCHGSATSIAPPQDLQDSVETSNRGVGAHQLHLSGLTYMKNVECSTCHNVPTKVEDEGHIEQLPAELVFKNLASDSGKVDPIWNRNDMTCSNVYCHGNFTFRKDESVSGSFAYTDSVMVGENPTIVWNVVDGSQIQCGSCHQMPPQGHIQLTNCAMCHGGGYNYNESNPDANSVDLDKHINGRIDR